jgi:hypothetical protein
MRAAESILRVVTFLGIQNDAGDFSPYGTGVIVALENDKGVARWYLVTAKHVIDSIGATKRRTVCRMNTLSGDAEMGLVEEWYFHKRIIGCDVAVTSFYACREQYEYKRVLLNKSALTREYVEENDVGCGDEVITVGLLTRHFGRTKNLPIVRVGNIAAMPNEAIDLGGSLGDQQVYLVESRSIGGLSGSPVFLHTPPYRIINNRICDTRSHMRDFLLGINIGLFETSPHADAISGDEQRAHFLETMSAGISVVVPIERAMEIINETEQLTFGEAINAARETV